MLSRQSFAMEVMGPMHRAASLESVILLSSVVAAVLLLPLRGVVSGALAPVAFAAAIALFVTPGLLLARWFLRDGVRGIALAPVGFVLSAGVFGLLGVPAMISHRGMDAYLVWAGATLAFFLAVAAWRVVRAKTPPRDDGAPRGPSAGWSWAPFALLGGILVFVSTRRVPSRNDDIWVYLSWVRDLAGSERLARREPYFGEETAEFARVQLNGWLLEQAALSRVSGLDTSELVLRYLTPTLVVVALLAVYALALVLFEDRRAAVLCGTIFALFHVVFMQPSIHNISMELAARIPEDKHAARFLFLPVALLFAVLFVKRRRLRYLGFFAFICWAVISVHPVVLADVGLCLLGFGLIHVAVNPRNRAAWTGMAALAVALWSVALGPVLLLFGGGSPLAVLYSSDINAMPPGVIEHTVFIADSWRHIHEFDDGSYMMHPWLLLNPVILGTYALGVPFLLWRLRESVAAQFLLGGLAVVTVVVYVPPVATFVGENVVGPNLIHRLAWPIPLLALLTAGWMAWEGLRYAKARLPGGRDLGRVMPVALVVLLAAAAPFPVARAVGLYREHGIPPASYHPDPIYPWLQDNMEEPTLLLTRDGASTAVPAYSADLNVVSYRSDAWIRDREELERRAGARIEIPQRSLDVHDFFHGADLETQGYEILRRHDPDYLMVYANSHLDERLETLPGFTPVTDAPEERFSLYKVNVEELGSRQKKSE